MNQIMLTLGLSLILQNLALVFFSADVQSGCARRQLRPGTSASGRS